MSSYEQQQQTQQQQQQTQPVVYPDPQIYQPPSSKYSDNQNHSNGSFGAVFIVLAVIAVLSGIGCVLGRLCLRRISGGHVTQKNSHKRKSRSPQTHHPTDETLVHEFAKPVDHHNHPQQHPQGDFELGNSSVMRNDMEFGNRSVRNDRDQGDRMEFGNRSVRNDRDQGDRMEFGNRSMNREQRDDGMESGNKSMRSNREQGFDRMEFGFDNGTRSSVAPPIIHGSSILYSNEKINGPISGSRRHVAFEISGDHRHDYHGGPRAS